MSPWETDCAAPSAGGGNAGKRGKDDGGEEDDPQKQQQEVMALYQSEKVNPLAGCLPMLAQIPVFFALYKLLFVTL